MAGREYREKDLWVFPGQFEALLLLDRLVFPDHLNPVDPASHLLNPVDQSFRLWDPAQIVRPAARE